MIHVSPEFTAGIRQSGAAFSLYNHQGQIEEDKEAERTKVDCSLPASRIPTVMASSDTAGKKLPTGPNRKAKHLKKLSIEECMAEVSVQGNSLMFVFVWCICM